MTLELTETRMRLRVCVDALDRELESAQHDLWDGKNFNVAPARTAEAQRLRAKGVQNFSPEELDYVMFKCFTTMGGDGTFRYFLPRFLAMALRYPECLGWASDAGVLQTKCEKANLAAWRDGERAALLDAMEAFAHFEWSLETEPSEKAPEGARRLMDWVSRQR